MDIKKTEDLGYARQYGIDNTNGEFIAFIDADDTFFEACSLTILSKPLKDSSAKFVISPFVQIGKNYEQAPMEPNLIWVFGHIYRRSFLKEHNIRFTPTRANEDVGFNNQCFNIATFEMGQEGGKVLTFPTYEWHYNEESITRRGNDEYEFGICTPGYIYNLHNAYDVSIREGVPLQQISESILETAFSCFIYYNVALAKGVPEDTLKAIEELSRKFYYSYYKQVQKYISSNQYNEIYTKSYNSKGDSLNGIIFKMTLDDFINFMFSKKVDDTTYEEIEKKVQTIAEKL